MKSLLHDLSQKLTVLLLTLALPLFFISTSVGTVIFSGWLYDFGFNRHDIARSTGIEKDALSQVAREIKDYFGSSEEPLKVQTAIAGVSQNLFNEKEVQHMADVKVLVRGIGFLQMATVYAIFAFSLILMIFSPRETRIATIGSGLLFGSTLTFLILISLGLGLLAGFDTLFTQFHLISFSNDLWKLNPATDNLIRIFPEAFFRDATLIIAMITLGQATLTLCIGLLFRRKVGMS